METLYLVRKQSWIQGYKAIPIKMAPNCLCPLVPLESLVSCHGTASLCMIEETELVSAISYRNFDTSNFT